MLFRFASQKWMNCYRLSYCSYMSIKRISRKRRYLFSRVPVPFYGRSANNQKIINTALIILLSVIVCTIEVLFHTAFGWWALHILKRTWTCRRLAGFACFCVYDGRTSPRAGHRAGLPGWGGHGTVAEEANETVRLVSRKGPRSAESTRKPIPATRRFWVSYVYLCIGIKHT